MVTFYYLHTLNGIYQGYVMEERRHMLHGVTQFEWQPIDLHKIHNSVVN